MASKRLIDSVTPKARIKDVKILAFGFSGTGTMSLKVALEKLGYKVYQMSANFNGQGKPFGREEFDKFLSDYDVLEDIPCIMFVDELLAAYPDAKVILTNRDADSWLKSFEATFPVVMNWKMMPTLARYDKLFWGPYMSIMRIIMSEWGAGNRDDRLALRHTYNNHYAHVRNVVSEKKLLEFESKDGWEPLCRFLGEDVPPEGYPRTNDAAATVKMLGIVFYLRVVILLLTPLIKATVASVALWAVWLGYQKVKLPR